MYIHYTFNLCLQVSCPVGSLTVNGPIHVTTWTLRMWVTMNHKYHKLKCTFNFEIKSLVVWKLTVDCFNGKESWSAARLLYTTASHRPSWVFTFWNPTDRWIWNKIIDFVTHYNYIYLAYNLVVTCVKNQNSQRNYINSE